MPIVGLTLSATREFQSSFDSAKGSPEASVFVLGTLDSRVFGMIRDKATTMQVDPNAPNDEVQTQINGNEVAFLTVQYGLRGWRNVFDANGNEIEFKTVKRFHGGQSYRVGDPEVLKLIPAAVLVELADEVRTANEMTAAEVKN